jgi:hypothetical protein
MADSVNLSKSNSKLNESLIHQMDGAGVRRSFTVPYVDAPMADHIAAVGAAAQQAGGITGNLILSAHHSDGKGFGHPEGHSTGHPVDKLRTTIITKDNEDAKATIAAAQTHLNNFAKLLGDDDPAVKTAQSQLNLVKQSDAAGMNLLDFGVMMTQIMHGPTQKVAQMHDQTKENGIHPMLRGPAGAAPQNTQPEATPPQGEEQAAGATSEAPAAPEAQGAPPEAAAGTPAASPEAPQQA